MKLRFKSLLAAISLLPMVISAQYAIDWYTIDGGGGTSTNGVYSISGTIGQPDAGRMTGGAYTLEGGFWGIVGVVQSPGAPYLSLARTNNSIFLWWTNAGPGFVLQQTPYLTNTASATPWIPTGGTVTSANGVDSVTLPLESENRFYRLHRP